jgi:hypothetical protein
MRPTIQGQRIGARVPVNVKTQFQPIRRTTSRFRRDPRPVPAVITDISVSGAKVEAARLNIEVRDRARLLTGDGAAIVIVRRIVPVDSEVCDYGVEFVEVDPQLKVFVNQLCVGARAEQIDWRWNIAR